MVLGIARPRLRSEGPRLFAVRQTPIIATAMSDWSSRRGTVAFEASADIVGGFPGFADHCCLLQSAQIRITSNYLLVNEGAQPGFGIPIHLIEGTALIQEDGREETALRLFYRECDTPRSFTLYFRSNRLVTRGTRRATRAQHALQSIGVDDRFADAPPLLPNFSLPWDQTREIESENVIWNGRANAPIKVGAAIAPSDVWLTTKSIIWGSGIGQGINRIPLALLQDMVSTRLRDRLGTPIIYLAIGSDLTGRFELPFLFNLDPTPDRNFRERGAFLVGLRSRGLPSGTLAAPSQPWRGDSNPDPFESEPPEKEGAPAESSGATESISEESMELLSANEFVKKLDSKPLPDPDMDLLKSAVERLVPGEPELQDDPTERFLPLKVVDSLSLAIEPANDPSEDVVLAEWSLADFPADSPTQDLQIAAAWHDRKDDYPPIDETEGSTLADDEIKIVVAKTERRVESPIDMIFRASSTGSNDAWANIKQYEELAIGALSDVLHVIGGRVNGDLYANLTETTPSSWEQAQALAELASLYSTGTVTAHIAALRRERILALGEVCVRLRTLVELFDGGYLAPEDLESRRVKLISRLSNSLVIAH